MPGVPPTASTRGAARAAAGRAWRGLVQVLTGPDPPPVWRWRSSEERRAAYAALGVTTLTLCAVNLAGIATLGQLLLAVPVVAPLPAPLVPAAWHGGWPWGAGQILALLGAFCLAGIRLQRPALWWMWALSLIPWWLWLVADVPNLNGPAGATIIFTAVAVEIGRASCRA